MCFSYHVLMRLLDRVLIFGAQDTTSSCLSRILHLLAMNTNVQDKIRQEIQTACSDEEHKRLDFDTLSKLPWLDAVVKETLRLSVQHSSFININSHRPFP